MERESFLEEGEVIVQKVRKHVIVYIQDFVAHTFGCAVFIVGAIFLSHMGGVEGQYIALGLMAIVLLFWVAFFYAWTLNYFDVWYLTDRHIIAVNQKELLNREEAFMEFGRIQDVFFEKNGMLETFLGYGTLRVQSAGTDQEFIIQDVRNVESTAHVIMEMRDKVKALQV